MDIIRKKTSQFSDLKQGDCGTLLGESNGRTIMKTELFYGNGDIDHAINAVDLMTGELLYVFDAEDVVVPWIAEVVLE